MIIVPNAFSLSSNTLLIVLFANKVEALVSWSNSFFEFMVMLRGEQWFG